jgi:predicted nucleic acid-binding protein
MTKNTIVGDSSPLIALAIIGQLELLAKMYQRVVIPEKVWEEVTIHGASLPGAQAISQPDWLIIQKPSSELIKPLSILLDPGEAEAIALAMSLPDSTVLLDDAQARRVAERFGINRIGTLGILRRAKKAKLIATIKPYTVQLQNSGIFISQNLIETVLRDVGELS